MIDKITILFENGEKKQIEVKDRNLIEAYEKYDIDIQTVIGIDI